VRLHRKPVLVEEPDRGGLSERCKIAAVEKSKSRAFDFLDRVLGFLILGGGEGGVRKEMWSS